MIIGLIIILVLVLFLPFTNIVERNLELFLFIMGVLATIISGVLNWDLIKKALEDPINITLAVLVAGLLFRWFQTPIQNGVISVSRAIPYRLFVALFVIILGLLSSIITAIVAAIILATIVSFLKLDKQSEIRLVVLACFAIGLGAALTPIGEPLSTIVVSKLDEEFFYLLKLIGASVIPGVIVFGILAAIMITPKDPEEKTTESEKDEKEASNEQAGESDVESYAEIIIRSLKIFLFVMALTFLGAGFEPFIDEYVLGLSPKLMYWINTVSAVLDNATLAAAEISPSMLDLPSNPVKDILMGLLISGGILIPGNIPNIIAAGKLKITSLQWAKFGAPVGLIAMAVYFVFILILG